MPPPSEPEESSAIPAGVQITGDPEAVERMRYFVALGSFTVAWATLEYIFDLCIVTIYHRAPGGKSLEDKQPINLSRKLKFFARAHREIEELKPHSELAKQIAKTLSVIGDIRNTVLHSVAVKSDVIEQSHLRRVIPHEAGLQEVRANIAATDIAKLMTSVSNMCMPLLGYAEFLIKTFPDSTDNERAASKSPP
jgi:hypothetical protein